MTLEDISKDRFKYKLVRRKKILSNSKFNVFFDHLITQEGITVEDFLIVKPKISDSDNIIGICTIPIFKNKFYLMRGWRHQFDDFLFQAPAGFIEKDESPSQTALRELGEETSLFCKSHDLISLGTYAPDAGLVEGKVALFLAMNCEKRNEFSINEVGTGNMVSFSEDELCELINSESNIGGSTIVTALRALNYLKNKQN